MIKARSIRSTLSFIAAIVAILLSPIHSLAQNSGCISGQVIGGPLGRPIPFALVRVCTSAATGVPCSPLTSVFYDPNLTRPIAQPFSADANGVWTACMAGAATYFIQTIPVVGTTYSIYNSVGIGNIGPGGPYIQTTPSANQTVTQPGGTTLSINLLNLPGTVSGAPTASGLWTFGAGITGTGDTGSLHAGGGILNTANTWGAAQDIESLNGVQYATPNTAGADFCAKVATAYAALPSSGGVVDARGFGATAQSCSSSEQLVVGAASKPVTLLMNPYTALTMNKTGGGTAIPIANGSKLDCGVTAFYANTAAVKGYIIAGATSSMTNLVGPADITGSQQTMAMSNCTLRSQSGATVTNLWNVQGVFIGSVFENNATYGCFGATALRVQPGTSQTLVTDILFVNNNIACADATNGSLPLAIDTINSAGGVSDIVFVGGAVQNQGANQPILNINGHGGIQLFGVHFYGTDFEVSASSSDSILITDAHDVTADSLNVSGASGTAANLITISESLSQKTWGIRLRAISVATGGSWTKLINNTISGDAQTGIVTGNGRTILSGYTYDRWISAKYYGNYSDVASFGSVVALGDGAYTSPYSAIGPIHLLPTSGTSGNCTPITWGANTGGSVNNVANAGIKVCSSGAFGTRMFFGTTSSFSSTTDRWWISENGHFLGMVDNTYDIGATAANRPRTGYFGTSVVAPTINATTSTVAPTVNATTSYQVNGNQVIDSSRNVDIATVKDITGTYTMGITFKSGSGGGNYTGANTGYANVDTTNLCAVFTIPSGWKLAVTASEVVESVTAAVAQSFAISDIGTTCGGAGVTPLAGSERILTPPAIATFDIGVTMQALIVGDGAAHAISLQAKTSNASDSWGIQNSSSSAAPAMTFTLMPSN